LRRSCQRACRAAFVRSIRDMALCNTLVGAKGEVLYNSGRGGGKASDGAVKV
jgi:hypothetical protein